MQDLIVRNSPANLGIGSISDMQVETVKEKGNAHIQFLLLPEFSGKHSCPETASDKLRHLRFLQMLCCSEESDNIFLRCL